MKIAEWTITIRDKPGSDLKDKDIEEILKALEWFDSDVAEFIEDKISAKYHDKIEIHVMD